MRIPVVVCLTLLLSSYLSLADSAQDQADLETWRSALGSADWNERRIAVLRLSEVLEPAERKADLLPLFEDDHYQVREAAVAAMYGCTDPNLVPALIARCADEHPSVRYDAITTLSPFDDPEVFDAVAITVADPFANVRRRAIEYFKQHDCPQGRDALLTALEDDEALNRCRAAEALGKHAVTEAAAELIDLLVSDPDERVRSEAASYFYWVDDPAGLYAIARALADEKDAAVRNTFVCVLEFRTHQRLGEDSQAWLNWLASEAS